MEWDVVGLERYPEYELGCGWYTVYDMGMWMAWKGISCTDWDGGWFRKVSHSVFRPNRLLIVCVPRNQFYIHTVQKIDIE
jgi:hypothetical protein